MKSQNLSISLGALLLTLLAACGSGVGGPGPRTWIDAPLDGSVLPLGAIIVRSHAGSEAGTVQAALMVDGAQVRVDEAADSTSPLIEFAQTWTPEAEGEYTLQVITTDHEGNQGRSNSVIVCVGDLRFAIGDCFNRTPTISPEPINFGTETPSATPTSTVVAIPTITFTQNANCRLGSSTAYEVATAFDQGEQLVIEGRNTDTSWFWLLIPSGGHCWVSGSTGTLAGPYQTVPIIASPPLPVTDTPEPDQEGAPSAPGNLHVAGEVCDANEYKVTLEWEDVSDNDGYRVYRDGQLIATLGANASGYTDTPPNYNGHSYGVEAFNGAGSSARPSVQEDGCLF